MKIFSLFFIFGTAYFGWTHCGTCGVGEAKKPHSESASCAEGGASCSKKTQKVVQTKTVKRAEGSLAEQTTAAKSQVETASGNVETSAKKVKTESTAPSTSDSSTKK